MARDEDEAGEIAQAQKATLGATGVMDQIIIPTRRSRRSDCARPGPDLVVATLTDASAQMSRLLGAKAV